MAFIKDLFKEMIQHYTIISVDNLLLGTITKTFERLSFPKRKWWVGSY